MKFIKLNHTHLWTNHNRLLYITNNQSLPILKLNRSAIIRLGQIRKNKWMIFFRLWKQNLIPLSILQIYIKSPKCQPKLSRLCQVSKFRLHLGLLEKLNQFITQSLKIYNLPQPKLHRLSKVLNKHIRLIVTITNKLFKLEKKKIGVRVLLPTKLQVKFTTKRWINSVIMNKAQ